MRIPTEIDVGAVLENDLYEDEVLRELPDGRSFLSPAFALGYLCIRSLVLHASTQPNPPCVIDDAESWIEEIESDKTYFTLMQTGATIRLRDYPTFQSQTTGEKVIPRTRLLDLMLEFFPTEYIQDKIILSSRNSRPDYRSVPSVYSYISDLFKSEQMEEEDMLIESSMHRSVFRSPYIRRPYHFAQSYAMTANDNPPTANDSTIRQMSNVKRSIDSFTGGTVAMLFMVDVFESRQSSDLVDIFENARRLQQLFITEANDDRPSSFVRTWFLKRMSGAQRRALIKYKNEDFDTLFFMSQSNRIGVRDAASHRYEYINIGRKAYLEYLSGHINQRSYRDGLYDFSVNLDLPDADISQLKSLINTTHYVKFLK